MLKRLLLPCFLFVFCLAFVHDAQAQRKKDFRDSVDFLLDDGEMTPDEMEEEAMGVYNRCAADVIKQTYYDCECIGGAFLSLREEQGPYVDQYTLLRTVYLETPKCIAQEKIAGTVFDECMISSEITRRTDDNNEEYCGCVANGTAKEFFRIPSLRSRGIETVRARAITMCLAEFPPKSFSQDNSLY